MVHFAPEVKSKEGGGDFMKKRNIKNPLRVLVFLIVIFTAIGAAIGGTFSGILGFAGGIGFWPAFPALADVGAFIGAGIGLVSFIFLSPRGGERIQEFLED